MTFDTFTARQRQVAESGLNYCTDRYGRNGLRIEEQIHADIRWKPTFHLRPHRHRILAAEVDEVLFPQVFIEAAEDIRLFDVPIEVYLICPLEVYMGDTKQITVNLLKRRGFGIISVDEDGRAQLQSPCVPLAQHIAEQEVDRALVGVIRTVRLAFKSALTTYQTNVGQGLQEAGQIVEAIVNSMAHGCMRRGFGTNLLRNSIADTIDALYGLNELRPYRASLGGARHFIRQYRNPVSHPPTSSRAAMEKINRCRNGFLEAVQVSKNLQAAMRAEQLRITIHIT
jgi:hypothetical protein